MDTITVTTLAPIPLSNITNYCIVDKKEFGIALKAIIISSSSLSILGALLIILVFYCKKDGPRSKRNYPIGEEQRIHFLRETNNEEMDRMANKAQDATVQHPARLILVCISAANIITAVSHIWGVTNNYSRLKSKSLEQLHGTNVSAESTECGAQAAIAIYGTIASFLWSDVLAFMAVLMLRSSKKLKPGYFVTNRMFVLYNSVCWGIPLLVVVILGVNQAIGFEEGVDVGKLILYIIGSGTSTLWAIQSRQ